ncbi:hypothetical protein F4778DRAFT_782304 [Xylariomycetidae sp. FL2044]|nr:hypothetical protein F4778DRAFT_782304 [Xylariomycetidae sp. FL2044]
MASIHFTKPAPRAAQKADDETEWEYEYSTTETETFYVTLDLTKADFTAHDTNVIKHGRGGWHGSRRAEAYTNGPRHNGAVNSPANSEAEEDRGHASKQQQSKRDGKKQSSPNGAVAGDEDGDGNQEDDDEDEEDDSNQKVQIMELHTPNPVISYKGRVYEGQWSENVGTEFLFAQRDAKSAQDLPALRHVDTDVDLLAASCARISVSERKLTAIDKNPYANRQQRRAKTGDQIDDDDDRGYKVPVVPPMEGKYNQERADQNKFLERLIRLKKSKGETDEVTVIAKSVDRRHISSEQSARIKARRAWQREKSRLDMNGVGITGSPIRGLRRGRPRRGRGAPLQHLMNISTAGGWQPLGAGATEAGPFESSSVAPSVTESLSTPARWSELDDEPGERDAEDEEGMEIDDDDDDEDNEENDMEVDED